MKTFVLLITLLVAVSAQYHHEEYQGTGGELEKHEDHYEPPHYSYEYKVHDGHTGDVKSAHETREGDVVKGFYSFKEADGTTREVHYTSDKHNGFNAEVKRIGIPHYPEPKHHY